MREIKFRAWHKKKKDIRPVSQIFMGLEQRVHCRETDGWYKARDVILMQFTGLHDKNGKEIYEGDILYKEREGKDHDWKKPGWTTVVEWVSEIAGFDLDTEGREIIGNIYENPELLSANK